MELATVKDTFERVIKRQKLSSSRCQEVVDQVSQELEQALAKIQPSESPLFPVDHKSVLIDLKDKVVAMSPVNQLDGALKELSLNLSKYPKLLEKNFHPDISKAYRNVNFDFHTMNQIIATHFYRQGLFDLGDCLISEAGEPDASALRSQFVELHRILETIKVKNLEPALKWASTNRENLQKIGSTLELKLHGLQFLEILKKGSQVEALNYAKRNFTTFAANHMKEIQKLFNCVLWIGKLGDCPYPELLAPINWEKLADELKQDFCNLLGLPCLSPLTVALTAGIEGLPTLIKLANVMAARKEEWQAMTQLPVPVELGKEFQFHSIFVCPVSRDQSSEENPPMLMPCLHVLCKQSIIKLSKGSSVLFKCPYCPAEVSAAQCRQLYF